MEYSDIKRNEVLDAATWKETDTKEQILYNSSYVLYLKYVNPQAESRLECTRSW
jgi:hypothetical protein